MSDEVSGPDLVRKALAEAKAAARARGTGAAPERRATRKVPKRDPGEPVRFGAAIQKLVADRGWEETAANAGVLANWAAVVGEEIAQHCQPVSLVDGELVDVAESTAWATQLRLLQGQLLAKIAAAVTRTCSAATDTSASRSRLRRSSSANTSSSTSTGSLPSSRRSS